MLHCAIAMVTQWQGTKQREHQVDPIQIQYATALPTAVYSGIAAILVDGVLADNSGFLKYRYSTGVLVRKPSHRSLSSHTQRCFDPGTRCCEGDDLDDLRSCNGGQYAQLCTHWSDVLRHISSRWARYAMRPSALAYAINIQVARQSSI